MRLRSKEEYATTIRGEGARREEASRGRGDVGGGRRHRTPGLWVDEGDGGEWRQVIGDGGVGGCSGDIGTVCTNASTEDDCLSMEADLEPTYFGEIPQDPDGGSENSTMYYADLNDNGRITIGACNPEEAAAISVTR